MVRVSEPNGRDHHPGPEAGDDFPSGADAPVTGGETAGGGAAPGGATVAQWISGARPRTWPNAFAPVIAGSAVAAFAGEFVWWKALLAALVAWSFIIGVNYANDYSDGIRGTDDDRVGPLRLTGSGIARPAAVKRAAFLALGTGAVAGIALSLTSAWWLIVIGALCIAAAWFYTGGDKPYGYRGLGEVAVFVFFGLVAVLGTEFVQTGSISWFALPVAIAVGSLSCTVNLVNNLRDIPSDAETGKITLAVRLGDPRTRGLCALLGIFIPPLMTAVLAFATPWALLGFLALPVAWSANAPVRTRAMGADLVPAIGKSGMAMLAWAVATAAGLVIAALLA